MTIGDYEVFRKRGYALAGGLTDLSQRASVYFHMYQDSGKRNVFPLIAAHGALWAAGYFKRGLRGGQTLSAQYLFNPTLRAQKLQAAQDFANKFRNINRRVCAESYAIYYYTKHFSKNDMIIALAGESLANALYACHESNTSGTPFSREQRAALFLAFFSWEQNNIVAPSVTQAFAEFDWPAVKYFALRPTIAFSYFGKDYVLRFADFSSRDERIAKGLLAYEKAEEVGLPQAEQALRDYQIMPQEFFRDARAYYDGLTMALYFQQHAVN